MARGVNKVILVGNCGKDPETRYTPSGAAVTNISIATTEEWKAKDTGEKQSKSEWHNIVFFGKLAEIAGEYLKKGSQCYIEGSLTTEKWTDKSGNDRYTTKIKANDMQMLGGKPEGAQSSNSHAQSNNFQQPSQSASGGDPSFDDQDLPF